MLYIFFKLLFCSVVTLLVIFFYLLIYRIYENIFWRWSGIAVSIASMVTFIVLFFTIFGVVSYFFISPEFFWSVIVGIPK